ncbi:hypothetical protein J2Z21_000951 [Streptomyces griseochromogenes]|uniref:Recombinase zinc beta ribbon domain-containing protein n=1 Tax=Streptomyces griseochromogenes TaxID=68214 RepID=A0ABS4LKV2_9ACTN|nr:hypothetical protein [Streptomyces griseochromogenes]
MLGHRGAGRRAERAVAWITCAGCGLTLAREHTREWWGDLSYLPLCHVVFGGDRAVASRVYDREERGAAWSALAALRAGCG